VGPKINLKRQLDMIRLLATMPCHSKKIGLEFKCSLEQALEEAIE